MSFFPEESIQISSIVIKNLFLVCNRSLEIGKVSEWTLKLLEYFVYLLVVFQIPDSAPLRIDERND